MKTKTIIELLTLTSSLYVLAKDSEILEKIKQMSEKGKENINNFASESQVDEDGNEMEFIDKLIQKAAQLKEEFENKIEESVTKFYAKVNIAHIDELRALNDKLEKAEDAIALLEARLNKLESK